MPKGSLWTTLWSGGRGEEGGQTNQGVHATVHSCLSDCGVGFRSNVLLYDGKSFKPTFQICVSVCERCALCYTCQLHR
jgi:hypothetical protein